MLRYEDTWFLPSEDPLTETCADCGAWVRDAAELCAECIQCRCGLIAAVSDDACECGALVSNLKEAIAC